MTKDAIDNFLREIEQLHLRRIKIQGEIDSLGSYDREALYDVFVVSRNQTIEIMGFRLDDQIQERRTTLLKEFDLVNQEVIDLVTKTAESDE